MKTTNPTISMPALGDVQPQWRKMGPVSDEG